MLIEDARTLPGQSYGPKGETMKVLALITSLSFLPAALCAASPLTPREGDTPAAAIAKGLTLEVIDAAGKEVGTVVGTDVAGHAVVAMKASGVVVLLGVSGSGFDASLALAYQSTDCTGQAFLFPTNNLVTPAAVAPPGQTLYIQSGPFQTVALGSLFESGACSNFPITEVMAPASPQVDLSSFFPAPFHVELR